MEEQLIKRFVASIKCGSCGQPYREDNIEILEHRNELWFLKIYCSSCHVGCYVAAIIRKERKPQFVTDLTEAEVEKFRSLGSITGDDVLDMHRFLTEFDGNFPRLFGNSA